MKRQLAVFFLLSFAISWGIWLPLYSRHLGVHTISPFPYQHAFGALGPMIAALLTSAMYGGRKELTGMLLQMIKPGAFYPLIALLSPFALAILAMIPPLISNTSLASLSALLHNNEFPNFGIVTLFLYNLVFFGFGEETGWRGFALPRLQRRFSALQSAMLLTVPWAAWHLPLFLYRPGYMSMDIAGVTGWILSLLTGSVLLTWFYNSTRGSILVCAIFHACIDIPFTAPLPASVTGTTGMLITLWGIATIFIFKPAALSRSAKTVYTSLQTKSGAL